MAGGRLPEKENKRIFQISGLKSGHSHLRNLVVLACERGFLRQYLTVKQNSHLQSVALQEVAAYAKGSL